MFAIKAGEHLLQAKELLVQERSTGSSLGRPPSDAEFQGRFGVWLVENVGISARAGYRFMRLALQARQYNLGPDIGRLSQNATAYMFNRLDEAFAEDLPEHTKQEIIQSIRESERPPGPSELTKILDRLLPVNEDKIEQEMEDLLTRVSEMDRENRNAIHRIQELTLVERQSTEQLRITQEDRNRLREELHATLNDVDSLRATVKNARTELRSRPVQIEYQEKQVLPDGYLTAQQAIDAANEDIKTKTKEASVLVAQITSLEATRSNLLTSNTSEEEALRLADELLMDVAELNTRLAQAMSICKGSQSMARLHSCASLLAGMSSTVLSTFGINDAKSN